MKLSDKVTVLKGIGEKKAKMLEGSGIFTLHDILMRFPRKYEDRRFITPIKDLVPGRSQLIQAVVTSRRYSGFRYKKKSPLMLLVKDDTGSCEVVFFNGAYIANLFNVGTTYTFYGKISENRGVIQIVHPEFHRIGDPQDIRGIIPIYPQIEGISQNEFRRLVTLCEPLLDSEKEWLPEEIVSDYRLADPAFAIRNIHFPNDGKAILQAKYRLVFDELLTLETGLLSIRHGKPKAEEGVVIDPSYSDNFIASLPFELTEGQDLAWKDISSDLSSSASMNRLIQGDVGSGKTALAEAAMYCTVRSG